MLPPSPCCAVLSGLRRELRSAELVRLGPEEQFGQKSSIVLLRGKLRAMGHAADVPLADRGQQEGSGRSKGPAEDGFEVRVQFEGPAVVPWLWKVCGRPAVPAVVWSCAMW